MEENSLTIAILKEIRDNTARTNDRLDSLTERVGSLEAHSETMAAVQVRHEALLQRLVAQGDEHGRTLQALVAQGAEHTEAIRTLIRKGDRLAARMDYVYTGPLNATVRDHEARIRRLEGREE